MQPFGGNCRKPLRIPLAEGCRNTSRLGVSPKLEGNSYQRHATNWQNVTTAKWSNVLFLCSSCLFILLNRLYNGFGAVNTTSVRRLLKVLAPALQYWQFFFAVSSQGFPLLSKGSNDLVCRHVLSGLAFLAVEINAYTLLPSRMHVQL